MASLGHNELRSQYHLQLDETIWHFKMSGRFFSMYIRFVVFDTLTHKIQNKMDAILQTTFSNAIAWMIIMISLLKFHSI